MLTHNYIFNIMDEFRYLNYHTEYSIKSKYVSKKLSKSVCFSEVFDSDIHTAEYTIIVYKGIDLMIHNNKSNGCLLSKQEIRNHINKLKHICRFKYSVRDYKVNKLKINIKLKNEDTMIHKFVLSWIRYIYEFPYNFVCRDLYSLIKDPVFKFESSFNLFHYMLSFVTVDRDIHQIIDSTNRFYKFIKNSKLKINILNSNRLHDIYKKSIIFNTDINFGERIYNYDFWEYDLERRKLKYIEKYKEVKRS